MTQQDFIKLYGEKTLKELFCYDETDIWLSETLFTDLKLSLRAHNTIAESFAERDPAKQTLDYLTDYTLNHIITRRNAGFPVLKEILKELYRITKEKDAKTGKERAMFNPAIFNN